jgi:hypothetical protein
VFLVYAATITGLCTHVDEDIFLFLCGLCIFAPLR